MTSYKLYTRVILAEKMKEKRLKNGRKVLDDLKSNGGHIFFFSDEKQRTIDRSYNRQNDRYLTQGRSVVPHVFMIKHPASVMTLGVIGSSGSVMPPFFFDPKERVRADRYCQVLEDVVIPWMKAETGETEFIFQQDSAPGHTSKKTRWPSYLLKASNEPFWAPEIWPSSSPNMNPLDFCF